MARFARPSAMNKAVDAQKMHGLSTGSFDRLDSVDGHRAGRDRGGAHTSRSPLMRRATRSIHHVRYLSSYQV